MSMRVLRFTKIDYIKTKKQMLFLPVYVLLLAVIMMNSKPEENGVITAVTVFYYMVFIMLIFSTTPFGTCKVEENGFLLLLPATTWDRVLGRFLYGATLMAFVVAVGIGCGVIYRALGYGVSGIQIALCLIGLAVGIVVMAAEYVFFYLCGENQSQNLLGIVRVMPGMIFYFVTAHLYKELLNNPADKERIMQKVGERLPAIGWGSAAVSIVIFLAAVAVCVKVIQKRGY